MDSTGFCLPSNWSIEEWPDVIAVTHEGTCEGLRVYVPERTCQDVSKPGVFFECSECGAIDVTGGTGNYTLEYCPACGAKVVE